MTLSDKILAVASIAPLTVQDIADMVDSPVPSVRRSCNELTKAGELVKTKGENGTTYSVPHGVHAEPAPEEYPTTQGDLSAAHCPRCSKTVLGEAQVREVFGTRTVKTKDKTGKVTKAKVIRQSYCFTCRRGHARDMKAKATLAEA